MGAAVEGLHNQSGGVASRQNSFVDPFCGNPRLLIAGAPARSTSLPVPHLQSLLFEPIAKAQA